MSKTVYIIGTVVVALIVLAFIGSNKGWFSSDTRMQSRQTSPSNPSRQKGACTLSWIDGNGHLQYCWGKYTGDGCTCISQ